MAAFLVCLLGACGGQQQPKAYVSTMTSDDSLLIRMGKWELIRYHSDKLGMDINYPSFLHYQELPGEPRQELFMSEDVSISVMVDSLDGINRSPGQQMMGMGAELLDATDRYSLHAGSEDKWEYYTKVIEDDTIRLVTVMLRYFPEHAEAVEDLREWVRNFDVE